MKKNKKYCGKINFYDNARGFGFIKSDEITESDVFFHIREVRNEGFIPTEGATVEFFVEKSDRGIKATKIFLKRKGEKNE